MSLKSRLHDIAKENGLIEEVDSDAVPAPESPADTGSGGSNGSTRSGQTVAALLMNRRQSPVAVMPPPSPSLSVSSIVTKPPVVADEEVVAHFREVANASQAPGYESFLHQVTVLRKHIHDDDGLYAAALESSGSDLQSITRAIADRTQIVRAEKSGSLQALDDQKQREVSANQARMGEIASQTQQFQAEIAERQNQIRDLDSEREKIASQLAATNATYQHDADTLRVAADQVLTELSAQADKLRSLRKGGN